MQCYVKWLSLILKSVQVSYSQWSTKMNVVNKEKKGKSVSTEKWVFRLYQESSSISDTIGALEEMCKSIILHIFTVIYNGMHMIK